MYKIIDLSITKKSVPVRIDVVQYATKPDFLFVLTDYTPSTGATASFYIEKPSGQKVYNACTIDENQITYEPTTQSFAEEGTHTCQLQIVEADGTAVSFLIYAEVTKNIIDSSAIESQDEFTALEQALQTVSSYDGRITSNTNRLDNLGGEKLTFTEATTDTTISDNLTLSTIFGRIKRLFTRTSNVETAVTIDASVITAFQNDGWTPPTSGGVISSLLNYILAKLNTVTQLTTTYTSNSYVTQTAWERVTAFKKNGFVAINGNLNVGASMPTSASNILIGKINGVRFATSFYQELVAQRNDGVVMLEVNQSGEIYISNYTNAALPANIWIRFMTTLPLA